MCKQLWQVLAFSQLFYELNWLHALLFPSHWQSDTIAPSENVCKGNRGNKLWVISEDCKMTSELKKQTQLSRKWLYLSKATHLHQKEPHPLSQTGLHEKPKYIYKNTLHNSNHMKNVTLTNDLFFFYITDIYLLRLIMWRIGNNFKMIPVNIVFELISYIILFDVYNTNHGPRIEGTCTVQIICGPFYIILFVDFDTC